MYDINEIGYHGTSKPNAASILSDGFLPSTKDNEWLGNGIYFFSSIETAMYWADRQYSNNSAVLQSNLCASREEHLNLSIPADFHKYYDFIQEYIKELKDQGAPLPVFKDKNGKVGERIERCFWCNLYARTHSIKLISFIFPQIQSGNTFGIPNLLYNRQICVFDQSAIRNIKEAHPHAI